MQAWRVHGSHAQVYRNGDNLDCMSRRALSATRAADLLSFLAAHPDEAFSYSQLSRRLQINLASTHNLLMALTECGYLTRSPRDRTFSLGPALVAIGDAALRGNPAIDEARVQMRGLSKELGLETLAFVRAGTDALCIARAGPTQGPGKTVQVGQRIPLMAPLSSVFVAWAPAEEVELWLLRGGSSLRERRRQREKLELVRDRGFSVALEVAGRRQLGDLLSEMADDPHSETLRIEMRDVIKELGLGKYQLGEGSATSHRISTITAPIFDPLGQVELAITLQVFKQDVSSKSIEALGRRLLRVTRAISDVDASDDSSDHGP
jgi:DNA-binding IclR family transcriptional regulator